MQPDLLILQFMGIVEDVGPAVKKVKKGDRVVTGTPSSTVLDRSHVGYRGTDVLVLLQPLTLHAAAARTATTSCSRSATWISGGLLASPVQHYHAIEDS